MGNISIKKHHENVIPSMMQKMKNMIRVRPKFIREETFFENRKRYLGTFTFVNIPEFPRRDPIPTLVESEKYENMTLPQKRYIV